VLPVNPAVVVSDHVLTYGDIILCVSRSKEVENITKSRDFFVVPTLGSLPKPLTFYKSIPVANFIAMLIIVATENIDTYSASLTVATVFLLGGWVETKEIPDLVDIKLLLLIGSSISFAKAVTKPGLALDIAQTISNSSQDPLGMMFPVYALTLAITELISNNAVAALMYPIAVALADQIGVDFKLFAMCVLVASTACFMSPIGYQTHMMVWAPGGYKFVNFVIFDFIPDIIYWVISCLLIPAVFPFEGANHVQLTVRRYLCTGPGHQLVETGTACTFCI
jgi:di/tricarboxylate transporter